MEHTHQCPTRGKDPTQLVFNQPMTAGRPPPPGSGLGPPSIISETPSQTKPAGFSYWHMISREPQGLRNFWAKFLSYELATGQDLNCAVEEVGAEGRGRAEGSGFRKTWGRALVAHLQARALTSSPTCTWSQFCANGDDVGKTSIKTAAWAKSHKLGQVRMSPLPTADTQSTAFYRFLYWHSNMEKNKVTRRPRRLKVQIYSNFKYKLNGRPGPQGPWKF
jgi:hypothetical protein